MFDCHRQYTTITPVVLDEVPNIRGLQTAVMDLYERYPLPRPDQHEDLMHWLAVGVIKYQFMTGRHPRRVGPLVPVWERILATRWQDICSNRFPGDQDVFRCIIGLKEWVTRHPDHLPLVQSRGIASLNDDDGGGATAVTEGASNNL